MIETKYTWTVYRDGELFDVMTDKEVAELMRTYDPICFDLVHNVVTF